MSEQPEVDGRARSRGWDELLMMLICGGTYWVPYVLGSDYSRGDFHFTSLRWGALAVLVASSVAGFVAVGRLKVGRTFLVPCLLLVWSILRLLVGFVAAAFIHVEPDAVMLLAVGFAALPLFVYRNQADAVVVCSAALGLLHTFWMACFG